MKIVMPMDNVDEIDKLAEAGANELYCSVADTRWTADYTYLATTSRRNSDWSMLSSYEQLKTAAGRARALGLKTMMAANELLYTEDQYPMLTEMLTQAAEAGVDAFIIADFGLMLHLKSLGLDVEFHVSLGGAAFNGQSAAFYRDMGAARVILPQDLTIREIRQMTQNCPEMTFEAFVLNAKCSNTNAYCNFDHDLPSMDGTKGGEKKFDLPCYHEVAVREVSPGAVMQGGCANAPGNPGTPAALKIAARGTALPSLGQIMHADYRKDRNLAKTHCGVCYLKEFREMGVEYIKVVGRGFPLAKKLADLRFLKTAMSYLDERLSLDEFAFKVRGDFARAFASPCQDYCYYTYA